MIIIIMVVITHLWRSTGRTGAEYVQGAAQNSPLVFCLYTWVLSCRYHIIASLCPFLFFFNLPFSGYELPQHMFLNACLLLKTRDNTKRKTFWVEFQYGSTR